MEISTEKLKAAYEAASEEGKALIRSMFPNVDLEKHIDNRHITERIKTFKDAVNALVERHPFVNEYYACLWELGTDLISPDLAAYLKLRVIVAALNEGWKPQFTQDKHCWTPYFWPLRTKGEYEAKSERWKKEHPLVLFGGHVLSLHTLSAKTAITSSCLCLKSEALADYCGRQFADLWADYYLIRK